jgi:aquaporin Z
MTVFHTPNGVVPPLAIGAILMAMIFAGGHISGGHYNPAVTLAVFVRRKITAGLAVGYMVSQTLAGIVAAGAVIALKGGAATGALPAPLVPVLVAEFIFTFALAWVVLNVATAKGTTGNSFYGLAIGFTVLVGAVAVGGVSGGAFNPAVAFGASLMGLFAWANIWIYLVGCLAGGAAAGLVFRALNPADA